MKDQIKENERIKKAYEKENDFLKNEVIGKGSTTGEDDNLQNEQSNLEGNIEDGNR